MHAEKYRKLLDLSTGEWELLDEDDKEDLVDLYYAEKKNIAQKDDNLKRRDARAGRSKEEKEECR